MHVEVEMFTSNKVKRQARAKATLVCRTKQVQVLVQVPAVLVLRV